MSSAISGTNSIDTPSEYVLHVVIIGGGISGVCCAIELSRFNAPDESRKESKVSPRQRYIVTLISSGSIVKVPMNVLAYLIIFRIGIAMIYYHWYFMVVIIIRNSIHKIVPVSIYLYCISSIYPLFIVYEYPGGPIDQQYSIIHD